MNCKQCLLLGALALTATSAIAEDVPGTATSPTRAQVKKSVSEARAAGQLNVGDATSYPAADKPTKGALHRKAKKPAPAATK